MEVNLGARVQVTFNSPLIKLALSHKQTTNTSYPLSLSLSLSLSLPPPPLSPSITTNSDQVLDYRHSKYVCKVQEHTLQMNLLLKIHSQLKKQPKGPEIHTQHSSLLHITPKDQCAYLALPEIM